MPDMDATRTSPAIAAPRNDPIGRVIGQAQERFSPIARYLDHASPKEPRISLLASEHSDYLASFTRSAAGAVGGSVAASLLGSGRAPARAEAKVAATIGKGRSTASLVSTPPSVSLYQLYRYASRKDQVLLVLGCFMAVVNGALYPTMALLFGRAINSFQPLDLPAIKLVAIGYFTIALALFVSDYLAHICFQLTAETQMLALRVHCFHHVLHRDLTWFETQGEQVRVMTHVDAASLVIKEGMGIKLGDTLRCLSQFLVGYGIGLTSHWGVSLVMASIMPVMAICLSWIIKTIRARTVVTQHKYAEAGAIAEETLRHIRTVASFNGQALATDRYRQRSTQAEHEQIQLARVLSIVLAIFVGSIWLTYAAGVWFGAYLISDGATDPGTVFAAFYGILVGSISLAQIAPNLSAVVSARAAAAAVYAILDGPTTCSAGIDHPTVKTEEVIPRHCLGAITVMNVSFAYPSRPEAMVLHHYSLTIQAGETVAFVGASGSGKTTLISLLQRFYDPLHGSLLLDGRDLRTLPIKWLREQMGVVAQNPVLFATTIFNNIAAASCVSAINGTANANESVGPMTTPAMVRDRVEAVAKMAQAHEFIMNLPDGYDTLVGERGVALSGGQRQRIAIARALMREPRILILDEATSALDTESEALIQTALDAIMDDHAHAACTTLIVAHRLSTIRHAHRVCVVENGSIVESGTPSDLIKLPMGKFQQFVRHAKLDFNLNPRNASLIWTDCTTDLVMNMERYSSVPMLVARSTDARSMDDEPTKLTERMGLSVSNGYPPERAMERSPRISIGEEKVSALSLSATQHEDRQRAVASGTKMMMMSGGRSNRSVVSSSDSFSMRRLMASTKPERWLLVVGVLASVVNGLTFPASAVLLSSIVASMVHQYASYQESMQATHLATLYSDVRGYAVLLLMGSMGLMAVNFVQSFAFKYMAEKLVARLRHRHFAAICRQDMSFFDDPARGGSGALANELATMATQTGILAGDSIGRVVQATTTFAAALLVSFVLGSLALSLVMCAVFPLLVLAELVRTNQIKGDSSKKTSRRSLDTSTYDPQGVQSGLHRAHALAAEAVSEIRTVASFGLEPCMVKEYQRLAQIPLHAQSLAAHRNALALGMSSFCTFAVYALVFWYGGQLVSNGEITFGELMRSLMAITISANGVGQAASHLVEVDSARLAVTQIFALEDRCSEINSSIDHGHASVPASASPPSTTQGTGCDGMVRLEFCDIYFAYPTRPDAMVLQALSLRVEPGQVVALCGPSGGGKSTLIALLERFYDPVGGFVTLNGRRLSTLNVQWLRAQIALISQEPVLFAGTIRDNIAYGRCHRGSEQCGPGASAPTDPAVLVTDEEIEQAAVLANVHHFVSALPNGYDTYVGGSTENGNANGSRSGGGSGGGDQLSGGQKQRIAIARAILKDAPILVLDEATSALDAESEQLVQDALDAVIRMKPRTTLMVAHRMRTIRNADKICVIAGGSVVEEGTHDELMENSGVYASLVEHSNGVRYSTMGCPSFA